MTAAGDEPRPCLGCSYERAGRENAEEMLGELRVALANRGLAWVPSPTVGECGEIVSLERAAEIAEQAKVEWVRLLADVGAVPGGPSPESLCRMCQRPFSPTHDAFAPGPTARHPFAPAGWR